MSNFDNEVMTAGFSESNYKPAPAGNQIGVCVGIVHAGKIDVKYLDKPAVRKERILIFFELVGTKNEDNEGKPYLVHVEETFIFAPKSKLKLMIDSWFGVVMTKEESQKVNVAKLLGTPCFINVLINTAVASGNKYNKIAGITPIVAGTPIPAPVTPQFLFNFNPPFKTEAFNALPEWVQNKIKGSDQYLALSAAPATQQATPPVTNQPAFVNTPTPNTPPVQKLPFN